MRSSWTPQPARRAEPVSKSSKQRTDADNAFLRIQNRSSVLARILSETEIVEQARDAKTARLKAQRLERETGKA